jgi:hypothetical protein
MRHTPGDEIDAQWIAALILHLIDRRCEGDQVQFVVWIVLRGKALYGRLTTATKLCSILIFCSTLGANYCHRLLFPPQNNQTGGRSLRENAQLGLESVYHETKPNATHKKRPHL